MKKIKLNNRKYSNIYTLVDDEDFKKLNKWKWYCSKCGYAVRCVYFNNKQIAIYMHRLIMMTPKEYIVDHINRNKLDNRKENLRVCTRQQNMFNRAKFNINTTSKYKGVNFHKGINKWITRIRIDNNRLWLGCYNNEKDAALIYDYWANKLYGEYAFLNCPNELLTNKEFKKFDNRRGKSSSKYIGVCWHSKYKLWQTTIRHNKQTIYLGRFKTEEKAALIRDKYIIENNLSIKKYKLNILIK